MNWLWPSTRERGLALFSFSRPSADWLDRAGVLSLSGRHWEVTAHGGLQGHMGVGGNAGSISSRNSGPRVSQRVGPGSAHGGDLRRFSLPLQGERRWAAHRTQARRTGRVRVNSVGGERKTWLRPTPFLPARAAGGACTHSASREAHGVKALPCMGCAAGVLFAPEEKLVDGAALPLHGLQPRPITNGF